MGLFDSIKKAFAAPDLSEAMHEHVPGYRGHVMVTPSSYESGGNTGVGGTALIGRAIGKATEAASSSKHIGGEPGSLARQLPREGYGVALTITDSAVELLDFGLTMREVPPTKKVTIPLASIASLTDQGSREPKAHLRVTFTDGSYFDYRIAMPASEGFWPAAESLAA